MTCEGRAPLEGIRVVDFSGLLPGPYASMMLADLGADVIRVESPDRVDLVRVLEPTDEESSAAHRHLHRSKRSIAINLKADAGRELALRLLETADVLLEQFRPGVMERLGLGAEVCRGRNPRLIYCSISGYGQTGPFRDRAGHDNNYLSVAGINGHTGELERGPLPHAVQIADVAGGSLHAVIGILAALRRRDRFSEGATVDISMTDAAFALQPFSAAGWLGGAAAPRPEAEMLNGGTYYGYYRTSDGRWFSVGSIEPHFMARLCAAVGCPELAILGPSSDPEDQARLRSALTEAFAARPFAEWREVFAQMDACVEPVLTLEEACEHPHLRARGMIMKVPRPGREPELQVGSPVRISGHVPESSHVGPPKGQHTRAVLSELGVEGEELDRLAEGRVILDSRDDSS